MVFVENRNQFLSKIVDYKLMIKLKSKTQDALLFYILRSIAVIVIALLLGIIFVLLHSAWPAIKANGFSFLLGREWNPVEDHRPQGTKGKYGARKKCQHAQYRAQKVGNQTEWIHYQ